MYISLYVKSNYSLLSSMLKIDDVIAYALKQKAPFCVINDINMYGTMEFIKKCNQNKIKPIISLAIKYQESEIILFAKNYQGYKSLIKLSTIQSEHLLTREDLKKYNKELLVVLPYSSLNLFTEMQSIYDDLYLGYTNLKEEQKVKEMSTNYVFFKEALYLNKKDYDLLNYLYLIRDGKTITDDISYDVLNHELIQEDITSLSDSEGLNNTFLICEKCNVEFPPSKLLLPIYKETKDLSSDKYLFELAKKGLSKRLNNDINDQYKKRLSYELKIINQMGFCNYFLVVYDFIRYAKKNNILVGPGRGSAAGSLVSYSLGITDIDPIKYDLLFERFLNPERKTMPDIDTDFPDNKRQQVIDYVISRYGKKNVSGIITFGTLGIKQVIRDVSRVLNIPIYKVDALSKFVPNFTHEKLIDFYQKNELFKFRIDSDKDLTKMFKIATKIEGFPRHTSSHAAGIIMSAVELDEVIPLTWSDDIYLSGYSMEYLENLGLLKMDFLGLKNLTIISNILEDVKKNYNINIDFSTIPLDDKEVISLFAKADTLGIFQFESTGMRNFLKKLKPSNFEDIFAAIALFRPGPADNIDTYIKRKNNQEKVEYLDPCLKKILANTYGIIIYQEQIIQVANIFAGYSLGEADILRRAMSKKKLELLQEEETKFIKKSQAKGHSYETSKKIFDLILKFAGYGFNRSHSVAYSIIAYKMAYLKNYYKHEFFANLLTNVIGSESKTKQYIEEAKANHIIVEKPNINYSSDKYIVHNKKIIFPFSNLKSIGTVAAKSILTAKNDGIFSDVYDCISRLVIAGVTKKTIECLILTDALKDFGYNRKTLFYNLDSLFNYAELTKDLDPSLVMKPEIEYYKEYSEEEILDFEKEIFGFYLTHHPTTNYYKNNENCIRLKDIKTYFNKRVEVLVLIDKIKVIETKKKEKMAFIDGSDETAKMSFTMFPKIYNKFPTLKRGDILKVYGNVEKRLDEYQIIINNLEQLN